jgi:hypothetical protein
MEGTEEIKGPVIVNSDAANVATEVRKFFRENFETQPGVVDEV